MSDLIQQKVSQLLSAAFDAHKIYEKEELDNKRDEQWPAWYADYLITNGLGGLIGRQLDPDDLAAFLEESDREFKATHKNETWQDYYAKRFSELFE